jgi:hypothetical protein
MSYFAQMISGGLGLSVRHIWNDPGSGNRSVEESQTAKEQNTGPQAYTRTEQRLINQSGFLERVSGSDVRFGFIEESDLVTLKTKAEVLEAYGNAAASFRAVFGQSLTMESFMSWMKRIGAIPLDIELDENVDPGGIAVSSDGQSLEEGETGVKGDEDVVGLGKKLKYGHVIVDRDGYVIGRRVKLFALPSLYDLISEDIKEKEKADAKTIVEAHQLAEDYINNGGEVKDVEEAVDVQLYMLAVNNVKYMLEGKARAFTSSELEALTLMQSKINFSLSLDGDDLATLEEIMGEHGVGQFDFSMEEAL